MTYAHITGWGMSVPEKVLTNDDLSKIVDTNDQWIRERTGIRQRHIAKEGQTSASLGAEAAFNALKVANLAPTELDLIICATSTPEHIFPATACLIQDQIGATKAGAFDLSAACSGFIYALHLGAQMIKSGAMKSVMVIGSETLSRVIDWKDRTTCILFGDGAGAFILQASERPGGVFGGVMHSDGSGGDSLMIPAGGSKLPATEITVHAGQHFIHMDGNEVFRFATRVMASATKEACAASGWKLEELNKVVPHQANIRIIEAAARGLKMPIDRFVINLDNYGNTSTASIPIATVEAVEKKMISGNDKLVFVGFGAGLTWGALAVQWTGPFPEQKPVHPEVYKWWARVRSFLRRWMRFIEGILFGRNG
jgi:3-oxoacyl-[acyl-carrier-protein] synthase-3